MEKVFLDLYTYFFIYSFLGWVLESIYKSILEKKIINSGFLKGPVCPIYGIGAIIMLVLLKRLESNIVALFFVAFIVLTIWEYIVGVLLEKTFKTKYWDYSNDKFNFQGRICLKNSCFWGILGVSFVKFIHPFTENIISNTDVRLLNYLIIIISIIFIIDLITTIMHIKNIKNTLEKIEQLNKEIKEKIKEIRTIRKNSEKPAAVDNIQQLVEKLKREQNRRMQKLYKNVYRLKKAFPAINTKEIAEVLNKKIEIRKKNKTK